MKQWAVIDPAGTIVDTFDLEITALTRLSEIQPHSVMRAIMEFNWKVQLVEVGDDEKKQ